MEDIDLTNNQQAAHMGDATDSIKIDSNATGKEKKKKKKSKDEEKIKKKKHKGKDGDKELQKFSSMGDGRSQDDINMWLEDVQMETTPSIEQNHEKTKSKKKDKKKHKKHRSNKEIDDNSFNPYSGTPKKQRLIDSNGVRLACYLEAVHNSNEDANVKATFVCANTDTEFAVEDAEIRLEGGQQAVVVGSNVINMKILPLGIISEHGFLKVGKEHRL